MHLIKSERAYRTHKQLAWFFIQTTASSFSKVTIWSIYSCHKRQHKIFLPKPKSDGMQMIRETQTSLFRLWIIQFSIWMSLFAL